MESINTAVAEARPNPPEARTRLVAVGPPRSGSEPEGPGTPGCAGSLVGRVAERGLLHDLLAQRADSPRVVHVQGIPGIGKSSLIDAVTADARALGYAVRSVPREHEPGLRARAAAEQITSVGQATLVVIDDWENLVADGHRLLEQIERATGPLVVLLGSRDRPRPYFFTSALFPVRFRAIELGGLDEADGLRLLEAHGATPRAALRAHRACSGHPLAMLLTVTSPSLYGEFVADLRARLVEAASDPRVVEALELLSLLGALNERELRQGISLGAEAAREVFDRLRALTCVVTDDTGLHVHEIARSAMVGDMRLRDPVRARALFVQVLPAIQESLGWYGTPRLRALEQLRTLAASATYRRMQASDPVVATPDTDAQALAERLIEREPSALQQLIDSHGDAGALLHAVFQAPSVGRPADVAEFVVTVVRHLWDLKLEPAAGSPAEPTSEATAAQPEPLPDAQIEAEVARALPHMRDAVWLQSSPLGSYLFGGLGRPERARCLQAWLREAIAETIHMRHGVFVERALRAAYDASRSIEEAAMAAHMGVSTFKRYRRFGIHQIAALARQRATRGPV